MIAVSIECSSVSFHTHLSPTFPHLVAIFYDTRPVPVHFYLTSLPLGWFGSSFHR
jgi:hypothetical protein